MNTTKIIGWTVFFAGLIVIGFALISSYNVFTGKSEVPAIFKMPKETTQKGGTQDLQAQLQQMMSEQLKGFLPAGSITTILNLVVYSMLVFILIFGGAQISGLGIKLIKQQ